MKIHPSGNIIFFSLFTILFAFTFSQCNRSQRPTADLKKDTHIVLIGNNLASRMINFGYFETELHLRYPDSNLFVRNMGDGGNTPGFRPHSSRNSPWAFPGAEKFQPEDLDNHSDSQGFFETEDQWLSRLKADVILAFFGFNESFRGPEGLENYKKELDAFVKHTLQQKYNGQHPPQLVLVSPIAFEDLSDEYDLPDGEKENENLALYTEAMEAVADSNQVFFVDLFEPTKDWFEESSQLTIDGSQLNAEGYARLAPLLADLSFGEKSHESDADPEAVRAAVLEKDWMWHNDFKIPNGVHAYGRRYDPFGPDNYPAEIEKIRQMTAVRDSAIQLALKGETIDLEAADRKTRDLPEVETNYKKEVKYLSDEEALSTLHTAPGFEIELFASEQEFPDLAKPFQLTFDNSGRLWVAAMPSYPHYKPGDPKPNDKLLILEDTDGDGKADKQTIFADGLHLPLGFEVTEEGVYVSQGTNLILLKDTDGDGKADEREILLSGFDDHDTHHNIHAFTSSPSGAIFMGEGIFLHTNVETSYGPVRATQGGFYRYDPKRRKLERTSQPYSPNPWGIAFDDWGQNFYAETSSPDVRWMMPASVKPRYGVNTKTSRNLIDPDHRVRPTSGLEFVSSRHFPDEMQGDFLINNTIGFLGTKQHTLTDAGTGYESHHRQDLLVSSDNNFRPVDLEFAPDGSLYIVDWHNVLIGHMQHNARDPLRDHTHGRIYRITYPSRPLVEPAKIDGASIPDLLDNLKLPEYRTRYRTRNELRGRETADVVEAVKDWVEKLDKNDERHEHYLLEALWVTWGANQVDQQLLSRLLKAEDYHARAAAVRILRYTGHQVENQQELLMQAAADPHGRVRLEAIVTASWLPKEQGLAILEKASEMPIDDWMQIAYETADAHLNLMSIDDRRALAEAENKNKAKEEAKNLPANLSKEEQELFRKGEAIYLREGYCVTCHQPDGKGLPLSGFPPLSETRWVTGSQERMIRVILNGMLGPITVNGDDFPGQVPMTPFGGLLNDEEVAAVATYVRNSFGNSASAIKPATVKEVREATKDKEGFYSSDELLKLYPL